MNRTSSPWPAGLRIGIGAAAAALIFGCHRPGSQAAAATVAQAQPQAAPSSDQPPGPPPPPPSGDAGAPAASAPRPESLLTLPQMDQLLAPIALYPDPLIGLILPSAGDFGDLQSAAGYLAGGGDPSGAESQPWSPSVQGLAHYPQVVRWMVDNEPWTSALGTAFEQDPDGVMNAIQDLRRRAQAAGTLVSTPQQQVLDENGQIEIVPAQPSVVYVPDYDEDTIYFAQPPGFDPYALWYWGPPCPMGPWLVFAVDWREHALWRGDWYGYYRAHGGWGRPVDFARVCFQAGGGPERWHAGRGVRAGAGFRPGEPRRGLAAPKPGPRPGGRNWRGPERGPRRMEEQRGREERDRR